jgi:hypothetical protein
MPAQAAEWHGDALPGHMIAADEDDAMHTEDD